ncbi:MAG: hypothetical protein CMB93_04765 [Flammeovirgaceae bacterium]|jgi:ACR3 family arsenite efflux pump ArsB|nr:hypothetical protein [Flammeovirgaceae bacterium]|tara:strand:- start:456 stop:836 length:381 start_codon:yes stop_codon:yes gene_type:complete
MKTKLTLTIIGIIMILQSIIYPLLADMSVDMMFNVGEEAKKVLILFQYAISSIFFMVGLILLFLRDVEKKYAKRILLAFLIAYIPGFIGFYHLATSPLTNAGIADFTPDIIMVALALFTYIKPKDN